MDEEGELGALPLSLGNSVSLVKSGKHSPGYQEKPKMILEIKFQGLSYKEQMLIA